MMDRRMMKKKSMLAVAMALLTAFVFLAPVSMASAETTSAAAEKTTSVKKETAAKPAAVSAEGVVAKTEGYDSIRVCWKDSGAERYQLFRATGRKAVYKKIKTLAAGRTSYTNTGLALNKKYYYKVAQLTDSRHADPDAITEVAAATTKIARPVVKGVAKSRITVKLTWKKVPGATQYTVLGYDSRKGTYKTLAALGASAGSWQQSRQLANTTYRYKVRAVRTYLGAVSSNESRTVTVRTPKKLTMSTKGFRSTRPGIVISKAESKLGRPYVWGASGPETFDCSGFTCWTMQNAKTKNGVLAAGLWVRRTSSRDLYSQFSGAYGLGRKLSAAQPGDIIIIGTNGSANRIFHVGIYYNNGLYIHANGRLVTISKVPASMVVSIIRLPGLDI
jgi:cell wall-associated NlpC family hydrolase